MGLDHAYNSSYFSYQHSACNCNPMLFAQGGGGFSLLSNHTKSVAVHPCQKVPSISQLHPP